MTVANYPPVGIKPLPKSMYSGVWFRPTTIEQLVELPHAYPSAKIVAGSSEVQVEVKFMHEKYGVSVYVGDIEGFKGFSIGEEKGEVVIGGNTSLKTPEKACLEGCKKLVFTNESRMAPKTVEAKNTMEALLGKKWFDNTVLEDAMAAMEKDSPLGFTVPGGMPTYRKTLAFSFLFRFWHEVAAELELGTQEQQVDHEIIEEIHRGISYGSRDNDNPYKQRVVGKQIPHLSGLKQATGEAEYIDDMPNIEGQLFGGLVLSKKAHAKLVKVNFAPALQVPGVAGFVDINDLDDKRNLWGSVKKDEPFFAKDILHSHGQLIGMVYAESAAIAQAVAQLVDVQYEELPPILTISEAIALTTEGFKDCDFVYEGVAMMGGQEHFYLKTNAAAMIPRPEDREMEDWSSTQNIMEMQEFISPVTGIPSYRIVAKVKRMGGGFGGKESRSVQLACILVVGTKKVGRPIRCMLNRDEDMMTSGQRNLFQAHWKVSVSRTQICQCRKVL
ncbi:hypothetical protein L873DRAFT_1795753 [Choiromyces venosus 120613-1]|uniref:Aldehyde oxidase/xanthine dehydrogenase a/b hammerhead domain-containing protein n=1 Tax=Choiromyces venosus 120613-1 TaxID=1336337 RepID=A0A3N4J811_9PEZI|nr:hypothetical protein L873DRAFT_1795753 [Choiromyces venosus 120613-1]